MSYSFPTLAVTEKDRDEDYYKAKLIEEKERDELRRREKERLLNELAIEPLNWQNYKVKTISSSENEIEILDIVYSLLHDYPDNRSILHRKFYDYLYYRMRSAVNKLVKLNGQSIKNMSFNKILAVVVSLGDYNAFPANVKAVIFALWHYLRNHRLLAKQSIYVKAMASSEDLVNMIEYFYGYVMRNQLSMTWARHAKELMLKQLQLQLHNDSILSSYNRNIETLLNTFHLAPINNVVAIESKHIIEKYNLSHVALPMLNGWSLLHYYATLSPDNTMNNNNLLKILIEFGLNVNVRDNSNQTPLHVAAIYCNYASIMNLCNIRGITKAAVDKKGRTPLQRFLENLSCYNYPKIHFIPNERIATIIKELLPNDNPLSLWEIWSTVSSQDGTNAMSFTERTGTRDEVDGQSTKDARDQTENQKDAVKRRKRCYRYTSIAYIVNYTNVSVGYEVLKLTLPLIQGNKEDNLLILVELFVSCIKKHKNSLLSVLLSYLMNEFQIRNEFKWSMLNILLCQAIIYTNVEAVVYIIENYLLHCEVTSYWLVEVEQSLWKRCEYFLFLYLLVMNEDIKENHASLIEFVLKTISIHVGQVIFQKIHSFYFSNRATSNNSNQSNNDCSPSSSNPRFNKDLNDFYFENRSPTKNSVYYYFIRDILGEEAFGNIYAIVADFPLLVLSSYLGNSVAIDSILKRIYLVNSSATSSTNANRSPARTSSNRGTITTTVAEPQNSGKDHHFNRLIEEFIQEMREQYIESILYAILNNQIKSIESFRNGLGYGELGRLIFESGEFPYAVIFLYPF
jgi:hypothetical protein